MIVINGKTYKSLNDKIYVGSSQVKKIYKGTALIYPCQVPMSVSNRVANGGVQLPTTLQAQWTIDIEVPESTILAESDFTTFEFIIVEVPDDYMLYGVYPRYKINALTRKCYKNTYISTSNYDRNVAEWAEDSSCSVTMTLNYSSNINYVVFVLQKEYYNDNYKMSSISVQATGYDISTRNIWSGT